ncbi:MAG: Lrp/AsnC family transcriptional regulator [Pseudomonadota bacterium]
MNDVDTIDRKILAALQRDARQSMAAIGDAVGLSASACSRRVAQLQRDGRIVRFAAELSPELLDAATTVIVHVSLASQSESSLRAFEAAVGRCREVVTCDLVSGGVDYTLRIAVRDLAGYERLHREVLSALPGVARLESNFVLRPIVSRGQPVIYK